jgi:hypothetical protein
MSVFHVLAQPDLVFTFCLREGKYPDIENNADERQDEFH